MSAQTWIERLKLKPHPEGGWYTESYRAEQQIETPRGTRAAATAIYFLLQAGEASHFHRLCADEIWHFYAGGPLTLHLLNAQGPRQLALGPNQLQAVIPADSWFAARPDAGTAYTLVGCTMAPGFDFADFELGTKQALLAAFPAERELIETLTLDSGPRTPGPAS